MSINSKKGSTSIIIISIVVVIGVIAVIAVYKNSHRSTTSTAEQIQKERVDALVKDKSDESIQKDFAAFDAEMDLYTSTQSDSKIHVTENVTHVRKMLVLASTITAKIKLRAQEIQKTGKDTSAIVAKMTAISSTFPSIQTNAAAALQAVASSKPDAKAYANARASLGLAITALNLAREQASVTFTALVAL